MSFFSWKPLLERLSGCYYVVEHALTAPNNDSNRIRILWLVPALVTWSCACERANNCQTTVYTCTNRRARSFPPFLPHDHDEQFDEHNNTTNKVERDFACSVAGERVSQDALGWSPQTNTTPSSLLSNSGGVGAKTPVGWLVREHVGTRKKRKKTRHVFGGK